MWLTLSTAKSFTLVSSWVKKKKKKNLPEKSSSEPMDYRIGGVGLCESAIRLWATRFVDFFYGGEVRGVFSEAACGSFLQARDTGATTGGVKKNKTKNAWRHNEKHVSRRVSEFNLRCRLPQGHLNAKVMHQTDSWSVGEEKIKGGAGRLWREAIRLWFQDASTAVWNSASQSRHISAWF